MSGNSPKAKSHRIMPKIPFWSFVVLFSFCSLILTGCETQNEELSPYSTPTPTPADKLAQNSDEITVFQGEDYSLPKWAHPEEYAGYVGGSLDTPRPEGSMRVINWYTSWAELEPVRGEYNWDAVELRLANAAAGGFKVSLHLQSITYGGGNEEMGIIVPQMVPDWVIEDFNLTEDDIINLGWEFDLLIIPGWRPEISEAFNDLVRAFGERGYAHSPHLASTYIMGISPSRGEEFWMTQMALDILEQDHGFTPTVLEEWMTSRFDAYEEAFTGVTYKVAWVGKRGSWSYLSNKKYEDLALQLVHNAWSMGAGNRSGGIEYYHSWTNEPALGQSIDDHGYLLTDETLPPLNSLSYFGDENEEYGDLWVGRFGARSGEPQRYRFSVLRALQMRMRFLWTSDSAEELNPPLSNYVGMSFGKTVENSPDAWAYLKETPVHIFHSPVGLLRNFERWLLQRDMVGGMTVPTQRVFREFNAGSYHLASPSLWYDDVARRTDLASGNPYIFFDIDDRFRAKGSVQIKVEILDDSLASWHIDFTNARNELVSTDVFSNHGDGSIKTITFPINNPGFRNGLENGMDFRIVCEGPGNVTVRWVRVVRMEEPNGSRPNHMRIHDSS